MGKKENGLLINEFDGKRICVDKEHSYPEYLKEYLYHYGIMLSADGKYFYNNGIDPMKEAYTFIDERGIIVFYVPGGFDYVAKITPDNAVYFKKDVNKTSSIHMYDNGNGFCYANQGVRCDLEIETDAIGNIFLWVGAYGKTFGSVNILVGEEHKKPEEYIEDLRNGFDRTYDKQKYTMIDVELIRVMISDPRVLKTIAKLMEQMEKNGSSIDETEEKLIRDYYDQYRKEISSAMEELNAKYLPLVNGVIACAKESKKRLESQKGTAK